MSRDRILFLVSFAVLGVIAAFLFSRKEEEPEVKPVEATAPVVLAEKPIEILQPAEGNLAVPFQLTSRAAIAQFFTPGQTIDLIFTSKSEAGIGTISLILLNNLKILAIGKDQDGKNYNEKASYYKPNTTLEILLEMTAREFEIFSYAQQFGNITIGIDDNNAYQKHNELTKALLESESDQSFNSILVTYMLRSVFPNLPIEVIATPRGYIATGSVPDKETAEKITKILEMLSEDTKLVVNVLEVKEENIPEAEKKNIESYQLAPCMRAVLFEMNPKSPILPMLKPGTHVDIKFISRSDVGFSPVSLTLLKDIKILDVGRNIFGEKVDHIDRKGLPPEPIQVILEIPQKYAEVFMFALESGIITLENACVFIDCNECEQDLVETLLTSHSVEEFQSTLVTYMLNNLFPLVKLKVTSTLRGYVVEGNVPDPQQAGKIMEIITKLIPRGDKAIVSLMEVEPQQVLINVKVFEVKKDFLSRVGINWRVLFQNLNNTFAVGAVYPQPPASTPNYYLTGNKVTGNYDLSVLIDMLEERGFIQVLAEPNLTTVSGETAHFFAGGEYPILVPQGGQLIGTVTVEYKKYGVLLDFTPIVDLNGLVTLHVVPEVSNLDRANSVILNGFVIPGLTTRKVDTIVKLWPGQSYIIGGLYLDQWRDLRDSLYFFNRIPIIGPLFNSYRYERNTTELMVAITPYIKRENNPCNTDSLESGNVEVILNSEQNCINENYEVILNTP